VQLLQPHVLVDLARPYLVAIGGGKVAFLFLFLEDLEKDLLLDFWHFVDLLHHTVEDVDNGSDEVIDASREVEP
jgi:hypothetical protein